jgi:hypothetical protein
MWRLAFSGVILLPRIAWTQSTEIPGRDLLNFPLGLTAEAGAIGVQSGTGLWNPATAVLPDGGRWRISVSALNSGADIGLSAQLASVSAVWRQTTFGVSLARAAVADLLRTESDPLSIGNEIPYSTTVISALVARRFMPHITGGIAVRTRTGQADNVTVTGTSLDFGILAEHLTQRDIRVGASTFLLSPVGRDRERARYLLGSDLRLAGTDTMKTVRAGYALEVTPGFSADQYVFAAARWKAWEIRGGPARTDVYGEFNLHLRLGVALWYRGYAVGFAREENVNGLAPTYHFSVSSVIR